MVGRGRPPHVPGPQGDAVGGHSRALGQPLGQVRGGPAGVRGHLEGRSRAAAEPDERGGQPRGGHAPDQGGERREGGVRVRLPRCRRQPREAPRHRLLCGVHGLRPRQARRQGQPVLLGQARQRLRQRPLQGPLRPGRTQCTLQRVRDPQGLEHPPPRLRPRRVHGQDTVRQVLRRRRGARVQHAHRGLRRQRVHPRRRRHQRLVALPARHPLQRVRAALQQGGHTEDRWRAGGAHPGDAGRKAGGAQEVAQEAAVGPGVRRGVPAGAGGPGSARQEAGAARGGHDRGREGGGGGGGGEGGGEGGGAAAGEGDAAGGADAAR
mmetsp:Transcript_9791/g.34113  ORF Transcript_9791/g.34113 Transcript_9791/m.34113 type:complete len:322 (+) Transcript_9791:1376-2341(+)